MARNQTVSIGISLNGKQAEMQAKALVHEIDRLTESLGKMQEKLADESTWGENETSDTIKRDIKKLESELKMTKRLHKNVVASIKGVDEVLGDLSHANYNELTRTRGLIQSAIKSLNPVTTAYKEKIEQLQQLNKEIESRLGEVKGGVGLDKAFEVLRDPDSFPVEKIREAISVMSKFRDSQAESSKEWEHWNGYVRNGEKYLEDFSSNAKEAAMKFQMGDGGLLAMSDKDLAKQKKYWQEMVNGTDTVNPKLVEYKNNLKLVSDEERNRAKISAEGIFGKVNSGAWQGTIGQTKEAYEQLKKYRELFDKDVESDVIKQIDQAMDSLKQKTKEAEKGFVTYREALVAARDIDSFDGTVEDLSRIKKRLEEIKATELKVGGKRTDQHVKTIDEALFRIEGKMRDVTSESKSLEKILDNIGDASLQDLERAAKELEVQIAKCGTETDEFVQKSANLRLVNKRIDSTKAKFKEKESVIARTSKRLASYVAIYAGFNEIVGLLKRMVSGNIALSDSLADVQKTTGLSSKEINRLSDSIRGLDTRTTTEELHQLAATAGQIGLTSTKDVFEFVKAANMINVALSELGSDGVASLMKVANATGEVQKLGVERSLTAIGSSINELSANSAASAPAIVDMVKRLGAISISARMSSADLAAIGATTDALAQSTEVAGTALSMFIGTLVSKTGQVAKAVGIDEKYLKGLVNQGKTTEAMIAVFEKMKDLDEKSGLAALTPLMGDLGSEGQRMTNTLTLMATRVDFLKEQVNLSRMAFEDATSVVNEFNIKNENAAAILQRIANAVQDFFTRAEFVGLIKELLINLYQLPRVIEQNKTTIVAALIAITTHLALMKAQLLGLNGKGVSKVFQLLKLEFAGLTRSVQTFFSVIGKHPYLAVAAGISVLGAKIYDSYKKNDLYGGSVERLNKLGKQWRKEMGEELKTSRILFTQLQNSEKGTKEYYAAKKAIQDNYGKYLEGMGKEIETLENVEAAQEAVTRAINRTVYARIAQQGIAEAEAAYAETTGDAYEAMFSKLTQNGKYSEEQAMLIVERFRTILEQGKELPDDLKKIAQSFEGIVTVGSSNTGWSQSATVNVFQAWIDQIRNAGQVLDKEKTKIEARYGQLQQTMNTPLEDPNGNKGGGDGGEMTEDEYKQWVREQKRLAKEANQAAMAALESYYNEREAFIRKQGMEQGQTEVDINRQLESLNTEKLRDEIELRKMLLDQFYKSSTFDPKKYKGVLTGVDYFSEKDLNKLREQLKLWGVAMEDGLLQQLTEREVKLEEQAYKIKQRIQKILLEDDFNEQVRKQYMDTIDELGLLFGINTQSELNQTKKDGEIRLEYMRQWAKESYNLNAEQLEDRMRQVELFNEWHQGRSAEDYEALLIQLRKFNDDMVESDDKAAARRKKIYERNADYIKTKQEEEQKIAEKENDQRMWDRFKDLGLVSDDMVDDAQLAVYQTKIDASKLYIEQLKKQMEMEILTAEATVTSEEAMLDALKAAGLATEEQIARVEAAKAKVASLKAQQTIIIADENAKVAENEQQMADRQTAIEQRKVENFKKYTDAVVEWSDKMTEAEWDDVESRKEATKETVRMLLSYLRDYAAVKLTELTMKAMFGQQETQMEGQKTGASIGMKIAEMQATTAGAGVEATADQVKKFGLKGLLIGAAITAALTALMNIALKSMFKQKTTVESISGAGGGKLATGMLTYKDGRYPTLGNDGVVYDAKYEGANMKTGIYRGGAHFGIFSEKKPEAIIDGDTTQRLIMNHPDIWKAIVTLSKTGRLEHGMRTFDSGNIDQLSKQVGGVDSQSPVVDMNIMNETIASLREMMAINNSIMNSIATNGIQAHIEMYGQNGLYKSMKKTEKFASSRGYR